ncbi:Bax inhibitor-1/YccA family protein [Atopomonas sediminilitoris]|uniref:Bax inhibitor-1/YccA family protein n=1 Tax=Atopomonas sediminilitoris TaxID=2919919 RepID=UPI001F4D874D|nr:Bax inhibitor-1/YccA family protein [Atopomonas sediminilitoris]MCJ8170792.1 Bax inhibitor-1/YccA family protein [Atopomonas sediminilitoris]
MQEQHYQTMEHAQSSSEVSAVLRNTYGLLALTLAFSALVAYVAQQLHLPHPGIIVTLVGFYGLFFVTYKLRNSGWGLVSTFALTGLMGYTLGPILNHYLGMANGGQIITSAMGLTALVFFGLSAYVLTTRKDMSFLGGFIVAGFFVLIGAMLLGFFFSIPGLQLAISAGFVLFASACILFETSNIIQGGERNYIMATISLYVSIYNLFVSLLQLIGAFSDD